MNFTVERQHPSLPPLERSLRIGDVIDKPVRLRSREVGVIDVAGHGHDHERDNDLGAYWHHCPRHWNW